MTKYLPWVGLAIVFCLISVVHADPPGSERPTQDTAAEEARLRDQITQDMQSAEKRLRLPNAGPVTQQMQNQAIRNIDRLIELLRNPPPSPPQSNSDSSPMNQPNQQPQGSQQPKGALSQPSSSMQQSRRERRQQQVRNQQAAPKDAGAMPTPAPGQPLRAGNAPPTEATASVEKIADMSRDNWGHLPQALRQELDQYYRDRFMPRYRDLVQEYYKRLAEQDRRGRRDR